MRVLFAAALFVSASAFAACPALNGNYKVCSNDDGTTSTDMVVTQAVKNGATTYTITSTDSNGERSTTTYVADGKTRTVSETDSESGMTFTNKTTVSCVGSSVKAVVQISAEGEMFANLTQTSTKEGQRLKSVTTGAIFGEQHNETEICE